MATRRLPLYDLKPGQIGRIDPFRVQFNGNFALVDVVPVLQGRSGTIEMRWQPLAPLSVPYTATLQLIDPTGATWSVTGGLIQNADQVAAAQWPIGRAADQAFRFTLPDEAPPGKYDVRVSIDQVDGNRAGLFSASGNFSGTAPVLASFEVPPLPDALDRLKRATAYPFTHRWDDAVEMVGFDSGPGVVINGDLWAVDVVWRGMNDHLRDLQVIWEVRDQADHKMFSTRLPLSAYPTSSVARRRSDRRALSAAFSGGFETGGLPRLDRGGRPRRQFAGRRHVYAVRRAPAAPRSIV